ncbi:uncharacterized protein [Tiliqua scincoides]|uniref:uncharacterized protein isoform X2 n=1 Tax=Tiliqua scincoides TaxID=71010 RepID=UPI0034633C8A
MEQLAQNDVNMNSPIVENKEKDPGQVQLLLNKPAEMRDSPANPWKWKIILVAAAAAIIAAAIIVTIYMASKTSGISNQQSHNSSLESWTEKTTGNTTADCLRNQKEYHRCLRGVSDFTDGNITSLHGTFVCAHCPRTEREEPIYFVAGQKVTWSEANKFCRDKKGKLFTLKNETILEAIPPFILPNFSYWFAASCVPSGTCSGTDGSPFDPTLYNVTPRRKARSCGAFENGKISFELCNDRRRFICTFEI